MQHLEINGSTATFYQHVARAVSSGFDHTLLSRCCRQLLFFFQFIWFEHSQLWLAGTTSLFHLLQPRRPCLAPVVRRLLTHLFWSPLVGQQRMCSYLQTQLKLPVINWEQHLDVLTLKLLFSKEGITAEAITANLINPLFFLSCIFTALNLFKKMSTLSGEKHAA